MKSDAPVLAVLNSLAALGTIWLTVAGAGIPLARRLQLSPVNPASGDPVAGDPLSNIVWAGGLGLAVVAWLLALLGCGGLLHPTLIGVLTLVAAVWGVVELTRVALTHRSLDRPNRELAICHNRLANHFRPYWVGKRSIATYGRADAAIVVVAAIGTLAMLVCSLAPATSGEAVSGSLAVAKEIFLTHSLRSALLQPASLATLWFQWALALDGPIAAGLMQWSLGLFAACAAALLARRLLGSGAGWLAGAFFLLAPGVQYQLAVPAGDLAAVAYAALAMVAWHEAQAGTWVAGWSVVAGLMLGSAVALEAASLGVALAILLATAWRAWHEPRHRVQLLHSLAILGLVASSLFAGWQLQTGSPGIAFSPYGLRREAVASLGVLLVGLAPAAIVLKPPSAVRQISIFVAVVSAAGLSLFAEQRWWLLACPLLAVLAAHAWRLIAGFPRLPRQIGQAAIIGLAVLALHWPLTAAGDKSRVAVGLESREAYLLRQAPEFAAIVVANSLVPADGKLLANDRFNAYLNCHTTSAADAWQIVRQGHEPAKQARRLQSLGITHVLLAQPDSEARLAIASQDSPLSESIDARPVIPLAEFRMARQDASIWRYSLLKLR